MQLGTYIDGRDLSHDTDTNAFAIGGTPVTLELVLEYDRFDQICWSSEDTRAWAYGLGAWMEARVNEALALEQSAAAAAAAVEREAAKAEAKALKREASALKAKARRERMYAMQQQAQYGNLNSAMVCPHCQTKGEVRTKSVTQKKGVSGGKATAAVLTGGVSLLATGLSRKESGTQAQCGHCGNSWVF